MLSRPTTEQILLDVRRELLETIDPAVSAPQVKVVIQMLENVLRNTAARAAHEIAWMHEEGAAAVSFARSVHGALGVAAIDEALAAYDTGRTDSLHLDDVCATYDLAGDCLSAALDAAMAAGDAALVTDGRALLQIRLDHELAIMGEWGFVGRG